MLREMTRRQLLKAAALVGSGGLLAACEPKVVQVTTVVEKVVKETVMVEGTPQVVEKVVKETVVIEKEVEKIVEVEKTGFDPATVVWWHGWSSPGAIEGFTKIVDAYHELDTGVTIDRQGVDSYTMEDKLLTAVAGGNPPDLGVCCVRYAQFYARGVIAPLDDFIDTSTKINKDEFAEGMFEACSWRGRTYGVPACECGPRFGLLVNQDHVEEAGMDPTNLPETWEDMWEWHQKITTYDDAGNLERLWCDPLDASGASGPSAATATYFAVAMGLKIWDPVSLTFDFNNEKWVEALTTIKRFYDDVGVEKMDGMKAASGGWTGSPNSAFPSGFESSIIIGYYSPGQMAFHTPDMKLTAGWPPTSPSRRGVKVQNVSGHPIYIPILSEVKEQAFDFIEFITDDFAVDVLFNTNGFLGGKKKYYDPDGEKAKQYPGLDWYMRSAVEADELWPSDVIPISAYANSEWRQARNAVRYGDMTPEEAAETMQERCTEELANAFPELMA